MVNSQSILLLLLCIVLTLLCTHVLSTTTTQTQESPITYSISTVTTIGESKFLGMTLHNNNELIVADEGNSVVYKVVINDVSNDVTTEVIAGKEKAVGFINEGIATDSVFNTPISVRTFNQSLFIVESVNQVIRRMTINESPNYITVVGGVYGQQGNNSENSDASNSPLQEPFAVFPVSLNDMYIAEKGNNKIRRIFNGILTTVAGKGSTFNSNGADGLAIDTSLNSPFDVFVRNEKIFISTVRAIRVIGKDQKISTLATTTLTSFQSIYVTADEVVYMTDRANMKIFRLSNSELSVIAGNGNTGNTDTVGNALTSIVDNPTGIAFNEATGVIYFAEYVNSRIRKLTPSCEQTGFYLNEYKTKCVTVSCFGIESNNQTFACSGNGTCIGTNKCQCDANYYGDACNVTKCFDYLSNETQLVCSGHGQCTQPNMCICDPGYLGSKCEIYKCFNKDFNDSTACSGNGKCIGPNKCQCAIGYYGDECNITKCYDYLSNETQLVCSGHGQCKELNRCYCELGYFGINCETYFCFNKGITDTSVCSGNGKCISSNNCRCNENYAGQFCEKTRSMNSYGIPTALVQGVEASIDISITSLDLISNSGDLKKARDACSSPNCTISLQYSWSLLSDSNIGIFYNRKENINGILTKPIDSTFKLTFTPIISIKSRIPVGTGNATFTLFIQSSQDSTFNITQNIILVSPPIPKQNRTVSVSPPRGTALKSIFSISDYSKIWSFSDETSRTNLSPLKFAIAFKYQKENSLIRISEFVKLLENDSVSTLVYLPYTNETSISQIDNVELFVICLDALNNLYNESIGSVSIVANDDSAETLQSRMGLISMVFPYDTSLKLRKEENSALLVESVNKISIDISNPTTSLLNLKKVSSEVSSAQVASAINNKLESYLSQLRDIYKKEKETLGFVTKQRLSDSDLSTTLTSASNLLSFGFANVSNTCTQLSSALLFQQTVKLLSESTLLPTVYSSDLINLTVSSFVKNSNSAKEDTFSDITLNSDYILTKYNGFNKEIGLSLISYNNKLFDSNQTQLTNSKDFTLYLEGKPVSLSELTQPIFINFAISNQTLLNSLNYSQIKCQFWNETTLQWDSNGCSLSSIQSNGNLVCQCSHTTLFAAFIENSLNNTELNSIALQQLSSLYIAQISFGSLFFILSSVGLILLIVMRKSQPLASRFVTPFIGMTALIVESALFLITQRSILLAATNGLTFSLKSGGLTESTVIQLENGNLAANIVSNIITIIVNTLTLTAMFSYLYQVSRFHLLKYFYNRLSIKFSLSKANQWNINGEKILKMFRIFLSTRTMLSIIGSFSILNVLYWTLWVILVRTSAISGTDYSYIVSISFTVIMLSLGLLVCALILLDVIMSLLNNKKEKDILESENDSSPSSENSLNKQSLQKFDKETAKKIAKTPLLKAYDWFIQLDTPLYFRVEMILFVVCFTFLVISQIIGLSGLSYKRGDTTSRVNDSISLLFEILYLFTYLLVFGGFALIVRLVHFIKQKNNSSETNGEENELIVLLSNVEGLKLFESFCEKEFSLENLHLFLEIKHNQEMIKSLDRIDEITSFVENIFNMYIVGGSLKEVNISSECRNEFKKMRKSITELSDKNSTSQELKSTKNEKEIPESIQEMVKQAMSSLQDQIIINLNDTFSRFTLTKEFALYEESIQTRQLLLNDTKLV